MAIRSWETVGHSSLAQAEQKSRVTVGNYSLIIMNRSNNHSVQLFLEPHNNSHNTLPSPVSLKKLHIPTLHSHFNSLTLRFRIPTTIHFSATPLPPSTPPFPLQPTPFPLPSNHPTPVKFPITHMTPTPQLQHPNCPTPSRDPSLPVTPPASPSSCSAVTLVLPSGSPSCRRTSARQAVRWLSHSACSRSASSASAERSRRDVSRRPVQREAGR